MAAMRRSFSPLSQLAAAALVATALVPATAHAAPPRIVVRDGLTQPVFSYPDAIRETVYVESGLDRDGDGRRDRIAAQVIRPRETSQGLKVPVLMEASPYYAGLVTKPGVRTDEGRGRVPGEPGDDDGLQDPAEDTAPPQKFPRWYDNYFVPRGYAVVQPNMSGTRGSEGCPEVGGVGEVESAKVVVDWLGGRARAFDRDGAEVRADWTTGSVGMYGKSWNGTLPNAVAATGVPNLKTIVPITAISSWYDYVRFNGALRQKHDVKYLADIVLTRKNPASCAEAIRRMDLAGAETGDYTRFWAERNYNLTARKVRASVFAIQGLNDWNVKMKQLGQWWTELGRAGVRRKLWLSSEEHVDPFNFRREAYISTVHKWFDHELHGVDNDVMRSPAVEIERAPDRWEPQAAWPAPTAVPTRFRLHPGQDGPGTLDRRPASDRAPQTLTNNPGQREPAMVEDEQRLSPDRLVYLTAPLTSDLRISGTARVNVRLAANARNTLLTAKLVDYGTDTRVDYFSANKKGGVAPIPGSRTCYGQGTEADNGCYEQYAKVLRTAPLNVVTRGWLDAAHRRSLTTRLDLVPGRAEQVGWDLQPHDYVFKAGHRIGLVLAASDRDFAVPDPGATRITVSAFGSELVLPVVR